MMNQWSQEQQQFNMMNNMGHSMGPPMGPSMGPLLPNPPMPPAAVPPLAPPLCLINEWNMNNPEGNSNNFIGPKIPDDVGKSDDGKKDSKDRRDSDHNRDKNRRNRSPIRSRNDRSRRDRRPRWSDNNDDSHNTPNNMGNMGNNMPMMPQNNMMPYGNMMGQPPMEMGNMPNMQHNMGNMPMMYNMMPNMPNMMGNMPNMMPNMMDPMMMQQQMANQPIFITGAVLLPPLPNVQLPPRRERPPGCRTIFIGGLPSNGVSDSVAVEIFQRFGPITDIKMHNNGVCHVRFEKEETVENSFFISGFRFKWLNQADNEATALFVDYALNREDQAEHEKRKRKRSPTPVRCEPYSPAAMSALMDKIKSDTEFLDAAPTLASWLERGECNKKNANTFYSVIQASNNQIRRLYNEKMAIDEEFHAVRATIKEKLLAIITQFEQVGKILTAAKAQRVSDHFSKQQRRNIEMWLKMTEDVENIKEEFNATFDEDDGDEKEKPGKGVPLKKYEELKAENEKLQYEMEGYKNEAYLARDEAERKFEKFKAHYIAQQALQSNTTSKQIFPPLPPQPPQPPLPNSSKARHEGGSLSPSEAKLISILTAFLLVHPLGASLDYLVSYVRSLVHNTSQMEILKTLQKHTDIFALQSSGVGSNIDNKWVFVTFDRIKK